MRSKCSYDHFDRFNKSSQTCSEQVDGRVFGVAQAARSLVDGRVFGVVIDVNWLLEVSTVIFLCARTSASSQKSLTGRFTFSESTAILINVKQEIGVRWFVATDCDAHAITQSHEFQNSCTESHA